MNREHLLAFAGCHRQSAHEASPSNESNQIPKGMCQHVSELSTLIFPGV